MLVFIFSLGLFLVIMMLVDLAFCMESLWMLVLLSLLVKMTRMSEHLLLTLLLLEFVGLTLVAILQFSLASSTFFSSLLLVLFTFMVCEASAGLGLLINFTRQRGSELMLNLLLKLKNF